MRALISLHLRALLGSRALVVVFLLLSLLIAALIVLIAGGVAFGPLIDAGAAPDDVAAEYLGTTVYISAATIIGIGFATMFATPLLRDRAEGAIEALLATPAGVGRVWAARSIALTIPAVAVGLVLALGVGAALRAVYLPGSPFRLPPLLIVETFLVLPLVYAALAFVIHRVALAGRVADGIVLVSIFLTGFTTVMLNLALRQVTPATGPLFLLVNLLWVVVLVIPVLASRRGLTREKVLA